MCVCVWSLFWYSECSITLIRFLSGVDSILLNTFCFEKQQQQYNGLLLSSLDVLVHVRLSVLQIVVHSVQIWVHYKQHYYSWCNKKVVPVMGSCILLVILMTTVHQWTFGKDFIMATGTGRRSSQYCLNSILSQLFICSSGVKSGKNAFSFLGLVMAICV